MAKIKDEERILKAASRKQRRAKEPPDESERGE